MRSPYRLSIATDDPDVAHAWLSDHYMPITGHFTGDSRYFEFRHWDNDLGRLRLSMLEQSMAGEFDGDRSSSAILVAKPLSSTYRASHGPRETVHTRPGESVVHNPEKPIKSGIGPSTRLRVLAFDRGLVNEVARELTGANLDHAGVGFSLSQPLPEQRQMWQRATRYLDDEFCSTPAKRDSRPACHAVTRWMITILLHAFPNSALAHPPASGGHVGPATVRRAMSFIDESATDELNLTAIAAAVGENPHALHDAFHRTLNTTPMAYLQRVRLEHAHRELVDAEPGCDTTLADFARRWGYSLPRNFSAAYHQHYGEYPLETLRR